MKEYDKEQSGKLLTDQEIDGAAGGFDPPGIGGSLIRDRSMGDAGERGLWEFGTCPDCGLPVVAKIGAKCSNCGADL